MATEEDKAAGPAPRRREAESAAEAHRRRWRASMAEWREFEWNLHRILLPVVLPGCGIAAAAILADQAFHMGGGFGARHLRQTAAIAGLACVLAAARELVVAIERRLWAWRERD